MKRNSIISLGLGVLLIFSFAPAQQKKAAFDGQAALSTIQVLAADAMMGRKSGEPGGRMAAEYIVSKLKEWGLEPAGPKGGYYQDMTYEYYEAGRGAALEIIADQKKREFVYGEDWRQQKYSGSGHFGADIVFAGYGISAPQKEYDDYAGVDVKGKLVLFSTDTPRKFEENLKEEARFQARVKAAQDHGALGVLTFRSEPQGQTGFSGFRGGLAKEIYKSDFVVISLENRITEFMFKHVKTELRYLFQQIDATSKPQSFDTGVRSFVNLDIAYDEKRPTENVLARIPGTDAKLRGEYVILGAHMDHLGIDMTGDVFNGADDNASGTAVVMEVARTMEANRIRPKRTIIFALWAAEEEGLFGSKYYNENPVVPLDKTVAYINLDMEGHGTGKVNFRGVYYAPEIWDVLKSRLPKEIVDSVVTGRGGPGGSDHTYFLSNGVPAYFVATDGFHFKTNRVGDVIELIKPEILKKAGDFVGAAVEALAAEPKVPFQPLRRENYYWKYETVVNHETPSLGKVIETHTDVVDPDVDFQLAVVDGKEGLNGDALRIDVMNSLLAGREKLRQSKGLAPYESGQANPMMGRRGGQGGKTTVLTGLRGTAPFSDDPRWADVFSKQGIAFVALDGPGSLFGEKGLSDEGGKIVETLDKAGILLIARGLDPAQSKALLESSKKSVFLEMSELPGKDIIELVKKTDSAVGLVLGKDEDPAAYFKKLDEARKTAGTANLSIVTGNCLWGKAGKDQMLGLIGEMLKAKYENEDLANLFSGTFLRVLDKARAGDSARTVVITMF